LGDKSGPLGGLNNQGEMDIKILGYSPKSIKNLISTTATQQSHPFHNTVEADHTCVH